jgi:quinohemoprotein ethanol dehydrogenase
LRGYVTAYDAGTGKQLWRFYTVPGNPDKGFESKALEMAARTWSGQWWKFGGGGTVWNAMAYDPELNRVYIGTSNGSPWNQEIRSPGGGDNLFLASIVALDADTGAYIWHYQTNPGDVLDYDASSDISLSNLVINGKARRVLMQASKNGFFYVIDRGTGKLISAEKFAKVTWAEKIDLVSGRPVETTSARYDVGPITVWPGTNGAHDTNPMAFNPQNLLAYIPVHDLPAEFNATGINVKAWNYDPGEYLNAGVKLKIIQPDNSARTTGVSSLVAWDPIRQQAAWRVALPGFFNGGIATTAGGLVFQGRSDGKFVAYSAQNGKELWSFDAQAGVLGAPITYKVGTRQYVSVLAGSGGWRVPPQRLLTFALGGDAHLPTAPNREGITPINDPDFKSSPTQEKAGSELFRPCEGCHGAGAVSSGAAPDLRASFAILSVSNFHAIVKGALRAKGMPPFEELSDSEIESVRQYLRARARHSAR